MDEAVELLRYEIKNVKPVTTEAYAQALMAVADELVHGFARFQERESRLQNEHGIHQRWQPDL